MKKLMYFLFVITVFNSVYSHSEKQFTILFEGRVKVNAHINDRETIREFFGKTLKREIEENEIFDRVFFDGGGFVVFLYFDDWNMILEKDGFVKSMQVGLLVPKEEYKQVVERIIDFGVDPMLPDVERYQNHSEDFFFHAPGNQVFRIIKSSEIKPGCTKSYSYDALKAQRYGADEYGMKKFVLAFLKKGPNRNFDKEESARLQSAHLKNIIRLADEGKLVLAGPFFGDSEIRGIYIFDVDNINEAKKLTETDPAVQAGSLKMELIEWYGSASLKEVYNLSKQVAKKSVAEN